MDFKEFLLNNVVILDGGMGTQLQAMGLLPGEHPEKWNITHPDAITSIHKAYFDAGSNVVATNTFGANILKFTHGELEEIVSAAVDNAVKAKNASASQKEKFIALDIGPSGRLLKPLGDLDFEEAVSVFAETVKLGVKYGVDLILIETMNDSYETKAALLAAKEHSTLPVIVSNAYGEDGKLMTGATPAAMAAMLEGMGADAIGANCSLGPEGLRPVIGELLSCASVPVILKPNAGIPRTENGRTVFDVTAADFAREVAELVEKGVRAAGGCCGTTPEYIKALSELINGVRPVPVTEKSETVVSSYTHAVAFGASPILIGERINPTGKKHIKEALRSGDMDHILGEGIKQQESGVHVLDVNVGLPEINEAEMLKKAVSELQRVTDLPLQIDSSDAEAMESALRRYNGKAMINSVNGKPESMAAVFPLLKKYGGVAVALTLDENGIPETAEGRVAIAERILAEAEKYGIKKKDIVFDTLAMTVSADGNAAKATLKALNIIKNRLGCHTVLGVSNVSFGLPNRDAVNGVFFAMALENGLSAAIMNPFSVDMMKTYYAYRALSGADENCADYIAKADTFAQASVVPAAQAAPAADSASELKHAVIKGLKEKAAEAAKVLLETVPPLTVVNEEIIPALDKVGAGFEKKTVYLPQLLMSAEAAKSAFEVIKSHVSESGRGTASGTVILATVEGDIHDIGKNIVKLLLENYGFDVVDLGRNVPPEAVLSKTLELRAPVVGLSALMTTTVPAMEKTVRLLKEKAPFAKTVVGGAVLTPEYAAAIGADKYAGDAMDTVRYAESVINGKE